MKNIKLFLTIILSMFLLNINVIYAKENDNSIYIKTEKIPEKVQNYAEDYFKSIGQRDIERFTDNKYAKLENISLSEGIKVQSLEDKDNDKYVYFILDKNNIISSLSITEYNKRFLSTFGGGSDLIDALNIITVKEDNPITIIYGDWTIFSLDSNGKIEVLSSNDIYINEEDINKQLKVIEEKKEFYNNLDTKVVEIKINTKSNKLIEKGESIRDTILKNAIRR